MKLFVYGYRPYDEGEAFTQYAGALGIELGFCQEQPSLENAALAAGCQAISIVSTPMPGPLVERFHDLGVQMISTRTVGYDHVDLETAKRLEMVVSNASYDPGCVADYTVMLMLMALRHMKSILQRADLHDFSLSGLLGRELRNCTVGVIGTGKIGKAVVRDLGGFGCRILAHSHRQSPDLGASYVPLEQLLRESDVITLHLPLTEESRHLVDAEAIAQMKDGVVIVNTARGGLIDTFALIDGLERGKIGAAALDVLEQEGELYHFDKKSQQLGRRDLSILKDMPNVVLSPHMAFYTREAVGDMVKHSLEGCVLELSGLKNPWRIV